MTSCDDLNLEQKINLIMDQQRSSSYRELKDKSQVSLGTISGVFKRKQEYLNDSESNQNKKQLSIFTNQFQYSLQLNSLFSQIKFTLVTHYTSEELLSLSIKS